MCFQLCWVFVAACGHSLVAVYGEHSLPLLGAQALSSAWASGVVVQGLRCPPACGIFPDQGLNLCPCIGRWNPNHWTTREVLGFVFNLIPGC